MVVARNTFTASGTSLTVDGFNEVPPSAFKFFQPPLDFIGLVSARDPHAGTRSRWVNRPHWWHVFSVWSGSLGYDGNPELR
jgi:hypothetical protein